MAPFSIHIEVLLSVVVTTFWVHRETTNLITIVPTTITRVKATKVVPVRITTLHGKYFSRYPASSVKTTCIWNCSMLVTYPKSTVSIRFLY